MIYSQATTYSLEALAYLASAPKSATIKVRDLARTLSIPEYFLGKLLSQLVKKRFVKSSKGPTGGFALDVDPTKITLYRILAAIDSLASLEEHCVMGLKKCSDDAPCALHDSWSTFKSAAIKRAQELTLAELSVIIVAKLDKENQLEKEEATDNAST
jgi:Rrf2 family transcriptional regulator, iron-sulfur cluster assembly transcription factor